MLFPSVVDENDFQDCLKKRSVLPNILVIVNNEKAKEKGIEIHYPTQEKQNEYMKALLPLRDKWAKTVEDGQ